ncbi:MAG: hypothetical protein DRQ02_06405 [Candidatus Latescibacterota bacterium]|nr:hypothetical protein [Candidatus Korarchaeota archaeon]RKY67752.1 MAG: hypothetical protein DRQ02_06405 [Candidatus Latescibacterota bacterium]
MSEEKDVENDLIKHMKELLLHGERMLDEYCPKCGTPLFLIKETGLKYCPKCRVYIATPEELQRAKIDLSRLQVIDFDKYWSKKERQITSAEEEKKIVKTPGKKKKEASWIQKDAILSALDELILVIIDKLTLQIERNFEKININELLQLLDKIIALRIRLAG